MLVLSPWAAAFASSRTSPRLLPIHVHFFHDFYHSDRLSLVWRERVPSFFSVLAVAHRWGLRRNATGPCSPRDVLQLARLARWCRANFGRLRRARAALGLVSALRALPLAETAVGVY